MTEPWHTSGIGLLDRAPGNRLRVTPAFLRAYLARPEMQPVEDSCERETRLFESLIDDPLRAVSQADIEALADPDAADNYRVVLRFRDVLANAGTLEKAYLALVRDGIRGVPPLFIDQLVHAVLAGLLSGQADPMRWRAAELFFRDQQVSTGDGRVMLADEETVEMHAATGGLGGLGQLLIEAATPTRRVELDVLDEDNKEIYWQRADRFDTVIDFRFTQPANDAFARVIEMWIGHFTGLTVRVQPLQRIDDERWVWHIGLDGEATRVLNALYEGKPLSLDDSQNIIGLYRMDIADKAAIIERVRGRPVYLAVARTAAGKLKVKPQNLLVNLPLVNPI